MAYTSPTIPASGTTFAQAQTAGASGHLERIITLLSAGTTAPTAAPTVSATGGGSTGGALAAGTYYVKVTESNGIGETTASPESTVFTVSAGNIPQVTFAALQTGNTSRNVYVTPANGATGSEVLYATGITTGTYNLSAAAPASSIAVAPPTGNSTGLSTSSPAPSQAAGAAPLFPPQPTVTGERLVLLRAAETGNFQDVWTHLGETYGNYMAGNAMSYSQAVAKLRAAHTVFSAMATVCAELGTLIDANPGHLTVVATPIGAQKTVRVWP